MSSLFKMFMPSGFTRICNRYVGLNPPQPYCSSLVYIVKVYITWVIINKRAPLPTREPWINHPHNHIDKSTLGPPHPFSRQAVHPTVATWGWRSHSAHLITYLYQCHLYNRCLKNYSITFNIPQPLTPGRYHRLGCYHNWLVWIAHRHFATLACIEWSRSHSPSRHPAQIGHAPPFLYLQSHAAILLTRNPFFPFLTFSVWLPWLLPES